MGGDVYINVRRTLAYMGKRLNAVSLNVDGDDRAETEAIDLELQLVNAAVET